MDPLALTDAERRFLEALQRRGVRFMVVGMSAEAARAKIEVLDGVELRLLPLDCIAARKRATGRPKDMAQLPALEAAIAVEAQLRRPPG